MKGKGEKQGKRLGKKVKSDAGRYLLFLLLRTKKTKKMKNKTNKKNI